MKLYYENAYTKEFTAVVTSVAEIKGDYGITLNRTAFYPEGGGQPFDTGLLGDIKVIAVHERDGVIIHHTNEPLEVGAEVFCKIDWNRRFSFMQGHTGEHILSGIIKKHFGLSNVGFHMGSEFITIDIDGALTGEQLGFAEKLANQGVYDNIRVSAEFKSGAELDTLEYRSKIELRENVRIVHIEDYDTCACCGVHCGFTGEVGAVKIINHQKYKSGQRIYLLCGVRALEDYSAKNKSAYDISVMLSAKPNEITQAVAQLLKENENLSVDLSVFKTRVLSLIAERIPHNSGPACIFENGLKPDELRKLCLLICERAELAAVFSGDSGGYKYAIGSKSYDVRQITSLLNSEFQGRGGGKKELVQGSLIGNEEKIRELIYSRAETFAIKYARIFDPKQGSADNAHPKVR